MASHSSHACSLRLVVAHATRVESRPVDVANTVIAGWTGRDARAMEHHIVELEALGVKRPPRTPMFYRVGCKRLTTDDTIEVSGTASSGEVEFVLLQTHDELWIGTGSDHTDREVETYDITVSKQMCDKPIAREFWRYADIRDHWDQLVMRSFITVDGERLPYQEGAVSALLAPGSLIAAYTNGGERLADGTLMFCGTLPAIGGVRPASHFAFELVDPVLNRRIAHRYSTLSLPLAR